MHTPVHTLTSDTAVAAATITCLASFPTAPPVRATGDAEHSQLCDILRRCAISSNGATAHLSEAEAGLISKLQQSFRDNLERKRRAAGIISSAFQSWSQGGAAQP